MKKSNAKLNDEIPSEIDFSQGVRGKYAVHFPKGSRIILLDSDVAKAFPSQQAANNALRGLADIIKTARRSGAKGPSL